MRYIVLVTIIWQLIWYFSTGSRIWSGKAPAEVRPWFAKIANLRHDACFFFHFFFSFLFSLSFLLSLWVFSFLFSSFCLFTFFTSLFLLYKLYDTTYITTSLFITIIWHNPYYSNTTFNIFYELLKLQEMFYTLSSSKILISVILLGYLFAKVLITLSQSISVSLYAHIILSPVSLSSSWVVLL